VWSHELFIFKVGLVFAGSVYQRDLQEFSLGFGASSFNKTYFKINSEDYL
jgi:hypothetical protein